MDLTVVIEQPLVLTAVIPSLTLAVEQASFPITVTVPPALSLSYEMPAAPSLNVTTQSQLISVAPVNVSALSVSLPAANNIEVAYAGIQGASGPAGLQGAKGDPGTSGTASLIATYPLIYDVPTVTLSLIKDDVTDGGNF